MGRDRVCRYCDGDHYTEDHPACEPVISEADSQEGECSGLKRDPACPVHGQLDTAVRKPPFDADTGQRWCTGCWGEGMIGPDVENDVCPRCKGRQYDPVQGPAAPDPPEAEVGLREDEAICPRCDGTGQMWEGASNNWKARAEAPARTALATDTQQGCPDPAEDESQ